MTFIYNFLAESLLELLGGIPHTSDSTLLLQKVNTLHMHVRSDI